MLDLKLLDKLEETLEELFKGYTGKEDLFIHIDNGYVTVGYYDPDNFKDYDDLYDSGYVEGYNDALKKVKNKLDEIMILEI